MLEAAADHPQGVLTCAFLLPISQRWRLDLFHHRHAPRSAGHREFCSIPCRILVWSYGRKDPCCKRFLPQGVMNDCQFGRAGARILLYSLNGRSGVTGQHSAKLLQSCQGPRQGGAHKLRLQLEVGLPPQSPSSPYLALLLSLSGNLGVCLEAWHKNV